MRTYDVHIGNKIEKVTAERLSVTLYDFIFYAAVAYEDVIAVYPKDRVSKVVESQPEATKPVVKKAAKKSR